MATPLVVHAHFYQPPRENPRTGRIDRQPSAAPFHDWNERVHAECYGPNTAASIPTEMGELMVNNFERISFDAGPTLLIWLEQAHPDSYLKILEADRKSTERLGHGNAIAQAFHHPILPLCAPRDARTEIKWGLADFSHRFGRAAEGLWLPETAANQDVLEMLIDEGLLFTILAPGQIAQWRERGAEDWITAADDHPPSGRGYSYLHRDGSGRSIALFPYDGDLAHSIAFDNAASSAERLVDLLTHLAEQPGDFVHVATDGETYGHHWRFGDLGLAYTLFIAAPARGLNPTNYSAVLASSPPEHEARLGSGGSSWSCSHGVERWRSDCGCSTGGQEGWFQEWREPLRSALNVLKDASHEVYERLATPLLADPWGARDRYVDVVIGRLPVEQFVRIESAGPRSETNEQTARLLLEMQRYSLAMFTSCGWFFADVGGIETAQILRYAGRVVELMKELGQNVPQAFFEELSNAKSNDSDIGTGFDVFQEATSLP